MTEALMRAVEAAEADAKRGSPGPWRVEGLPDYSMVRVLTDEGQVADCWDGNAFPPSECAANAEVIAAARAREPVLAAGVRELMGQLTEARATIARWEALGARRDLKLRHPGCRCHQEEGDSPCPIHADASEGLATHET